MILVRRCVLIEEVTLSPDLRQVGGWVAWESVVREGGPGRNIQCAYVDVEG